MEKIAGRTFEDRMRAVEPLKNDISFEAEAMFADKTKWDVHMKDLIINFEEDLVNDELLKAMQELRSAEKQGDHAGVAEYAKKCQVLSMRKAEVGKKRRN
jgi:hypothetical protein